MQRPDIDQLALLAGVLTIAVALVHLMHPQAGFPRLLEMVMVGALLFDPRPFTFTVIGVAMILGVLLVWNGLLPRRESYLAAMGLMILFMVGYAIWHLTGHGGFWPWREGHHHGGAPWEILWNHYWTDTWGQLSKTLEAITLAVLAYLYWVDIHSTE